MMEDGGVEGRRWRVRRLMWRWRRRRRNVENEKEVRGKL
jgi:hypothetical protein